MKRILTLALALMLLGSVALAETTVHVSMPGASEVYGPAETATAHPTEMPAEIPAAPEPSNAPVTELPAEETKIFTSLHGAYTVVMPAETVQFSDEQIDDLLRSDRIWHALLSWDASAYDRQVNEKVDMYDLDGNGECEIVITMAEQHTLSPDDLTERPDLVLAYIQATTPDAVSTTIVPDRPVIAQELLDGSLKYTVVTDSPLTVIVQAHGIENARIGEILMSLEIVQ